jgi:hypothetical protein
MGEASAYLATNCGDIKTKTALKNLQRGKTGSECGQSALAGFETRIGLVDDVNATFATDQLVVAMALHKTLEGIADFHGYTYMMARKPSNSKLAQSLAMRQ